MFLREPVIWWDFFLWRGAKEIALVVLPLAMHEYTPNSVVGISSFLKNKKLNKVELFILWSRRDSNSRPVMVLYTLSTCLASLWLSEEGR